MYEDKVCEFCGIKFVPTKRSYQKYCQYSCGQRAWEKKKAEDKRTNAPIGQCKFCLKEFQPEHWHSGDRQIYCSDRCKAEFFKATKRADNAQRREDIRAECAHCQKSFVPRRHVSEKFCSNSCKINFHAEGQKKKREEVRKNTVRLCPICETKFNPNYSMREIYCSPKCRKAIGRRIYKMMATCYKSTQTKKADTSHKVLGYSPNQLLEHLQKNENWAKIKHGDWHLDHIFPIIAFVRKGITDIGLICCLDNLQPLPGKDNCQKNDNYSEAAFEAWLKDRLVHA